MAILTKVRSSVNRLLEPLNVEIATLTAKRQETRRLEGLMAAGLFDRPYSLLPGMNAFDPSLLASAYARHRDAIGRLRQLGGNDVGYVPDNDFFSTPDMEILYLMVAMYAPRQIVEIGCGNSTRVARQAIIDNGLSTQITAVDPHPRADIADVVDRFEQSRLEDLADLEFVEGLRANDILFVDSSHLVQVGNDVARIFCDLAPRLNKGVILHFHDIFLPFEYPTKHLKYGRQWGEQYVLHAMLQCGAHEILWPGFYLQRTSPAAVSRLPFLADGVAQSFWFRLG